MTSGEARVIKKSLSTLVHKFGHVFFLCSEAFWFWPGCFDLVQQSIKIAAGKFPLEWFGDLFIVALEAQQPLPECFERREIIGRKGLSLKDREVDLNLI